MSNDINMTERDERCELTTLNGKIPKPITYQEYTQVYKLNEATKFMLLPSTLLTAVRNGKPHN